MAHDPTKTTDLTAVMQTFYDKLMLERLTPQLRFWQLGDKKSLPKNAGKDISWTRFTNLGEGSKLTQGTTPDSISLSAASVSATLFQLGQLVQPTDLIDMTAITDIMKQSVSLLTDGAAKTVDAFIEERFQPLRNASTIGFRAAHPAFDAFTNYAGTFGLRIGGSANTLTTSALRKQALALSSVRKMATQLRKWNAPTYDDGYYAAVVHPHVSDQLRADKNFQIWNQFQNPQAMWKGEIGFAEGCRFVESTNIDTIAKKSSAGSSLGVIYVSYLFGKHAFGVVDFDGRKKIYVVQGADKTDPLDQYRFVGYKITMAAKCLNDSCGLIALTSENT